MHGILDSYRREKGLAPATLPQQQQQQSTGGSTTSLLEKAGQGLAGVSTGQKLLLGLTAACLLLDFMMPQGPLTSRSTLRSNTVALLPAANVVCVPLVQLLRRRQQQQQQESWEDADTPCFVECVSPVITEQELQSALDEAGPDALVVVDFYKTACGACKYIQPG
jgi:thiol:disulfide interchange protein